MDVESQMRAITAELDALKDRVRNIIDHGHWPTDGEWKESVLRSMLRRHLPANVGVGRGFVVGACRCSRQIDVVLYALDKPIIYKDGDLVFITPDVVRGIIEVKTRCRDPGELGRQLEKLTQNAEVIGIDNVFVGLFAYGTSMDRTHAEAILDALEHNAAESLARVVNHLTLGPDLFVRFWTQDPETENGEDGYNRWHIYELPRQSPGYFINNAVDSVAAESVGRNRLVWFPGRGKEPRKIGERPLVRKRRTAASLATTTSDET